MQRSAIGIFFGLSLPLMACGGHPPPPAATAASAPAVENLTPEQEAALFARESTASFAPVSVTALEGQMTVTVNAVGTPTVTTKENEAGELVSRVEIGIGSKTPLLCVLRRGRLDAGGAVQQITAPLSSPEALGGRPFRPEVGVRVVSGTPVLSFASRYVEQGKGDVPSGPGLGKVAAASRDEGSILCMHYEAGYQATFAKLVDGIIGSARFAKSAPAPRWHEVRLMEKEGGIAYVERDVFDSQKKGQIISRSIFAGIAIEQGKWSGLDAASTVAYEAKGGEVVEESSAYGSGGKLAAEMKLTRTGAHEYSYEGKVASAPVHGSFKTKERITSELSRAMLRAWAAGHSGDAHFHYYDDLGNPKGATDVHVTKGSGRTITVETPSRTRLRTDRSPRRGLASGLRTVRLIGDGIGELDDGLEALRVEDRSLSEKIAAYDRSAKELGQSVGEVNRAVDALGRDVGPVYLSVVQADAALRDACKASKTSKTKQTDCADLEATFADIDKGAYGGDNPAQMAKLRTAIAAVTLRASRAKLAQGKLVDALDGLVAVLQQVQRVAEPAMQHFQRAGEAAKTAATGLRAYCTTGNTTPPLGPPLADPGEWVTAATSPGGDARDLTVVVSFKPPGSLAADFEQAARGATGTYGPLYRAAAMGGFGSGFVVVHRSARDDRSVPYVVTNRHVVDLADHDTVTRADGSSLRARIVYSDPHYDLAVLALETEAKVFDHGFAFETAPGKDQQAVAAVGYPGLGSEPSYQVTKGYVSNDRFELDTGGLKLHYLQHTAPIDRGSSGGPLLSEGGNVLGVNTLKATGRENVAFAVPQAAVIDAVRYAATLDARMASAAFRKQRLRDDCLDLVAELASAHPRTAHAEQLASTRMIAEQGVESYNLLSKGDENLQ